MFLLCQLIILYQTEGISKVKIGKKRAFPNKKWEKRRKIMIDTIESGPFSRTHFFNYFTSKQFDPLITKTAKNAGWVLFGTNIEKSSCPFSWPTFEGYSLNTRKLDAHYNSLFVYDHFYFFEVVFLILQNHGSSLSHLWIMNHI